MAITLSHNKATRAVSVTVTFQADPQVEKAGLAKNVIENHLLMQACNRCRLAADAALNAPSATEDADLAAAKAQLDADLAAKKAARGGLVSNVVKN
jgi:poly-gamma-glutamate capsule biosynthesis protein CapA/YwtB (metallophosphatase superfamily)